MYYVEEIFNGKLYYKTTPNGEWILICYEELLDRLIKAENDLAVYTERFDIDESM